MFSDSESEVCVGMVEKVSKEKKRDAQKFRFRTRFDIEPSEVCKTTKAKVSQEGQESGDGGIFRQCFDGGCECI